MANNLGSWGNSEMPPLHFSMKPQNAGAQLLYEIMGGVIPQSAKGQGTPVQAQHQQIALVSLHAFDDRLHFVLPTSSVVKIMPSC